MTAAARHPLFPEIPTAIECGLPGFQIATWNIVAAPRGMDPGLARHINAAINDVLRDPVAANRLVVAGLDPILDSTPQTTRDYVANQVASFRDIVQRTGLRLGR